MSLVEKDPLREQYFEEVHCPEYVLISTDDVLPYRLYPEHRWVYDKLKICETQGIEHAPHGIEPERYPVFGKTIYNLRGMGTGGRIVESARDFERIQQPGHLWMEMLEGEHVSTDIFVIEGAPHVVDRRAGHGPGADPGRRGRSGDRGRRDGTSGGSGAGHERAPGRLPLLSTWVPAQGLKGTELQRSWLGSTSPGSRTPRARGRARTVSRHARND